MPSKPRTRLLVVLLVKLTIVALLSFLTAEQLPKLLATQGIQAQKPEGHTQTSGDR